MSMERHDDIAARLGDYVLGEVTADDRNAIERHVASCAECTGELRELPLVMEGLARVPEAVVPLPRGPGAARSSWPFGSLTSWRSPHRFLCSAAPPFRVSSPAVTWRDCHI